MNHFIAIDIETTGLEPRQDQILEIGAVLFDDQDLYKPIDELPQFHTLVSHKRYHGSPFALHMNAEILLQLARGEGVPLRAALSGLFSFLEQHQTDRPYPVGFNVGTFDMAFLREAGWQVERPVIEQAFHHRCVDLGTYLSKDGTPVSSSKAVQEVLGYEVPHRALDDAKVAVELWRWAKTGNKL